MLKYKEKIIFLEQELGSKSLNYADSFKIDILIFIDEFNSGNPVLGFLNDLSSFDEITLWIERLTSRIVLKFDDENESINDFIYDYISLG
tara:strand:+ start:1194 stop:1463 length:270 start_codon:yes stop_codon:yes gene_type:complete